MILVLLGTQNNSFERLLKEIEKCINDGIIKEKVIVQAGFTKFSSEKMEILKLIPMENLNKLIDEANFIITHGGVGSIVSSIKKGKKVIAVPRQKKYNEHVNDHQLQIVNSFADVGYIKKVIEVGKLRNVINKIDEFVPKKFESNTENIIRMIEEFIEQ